MAGGNLARGKRSQASATFWQALSYLYLQRIIISGIANESFEVQHSSACWQLASAVNATTGHSPSTSRACQV
jgi:hypothetical protein